MEYRLFSKTGKKYYTEKDYHGVHSHVSLTPSGRVISYHDSLGFEDITDQVIVEQWIGAFDTESTPPKKIYDGDKLLVGYEDCEQKYDEEKDEYVDTEIYIVQYQIDSQYAAFDLVPLPGEKRPGWFEDCQCSQLSYVLNTGRCKVVGTIHDESEVKQWVNYRYLFFYIRLL